MPGWRQVVTEDDVNAPGGVAPLDGGLKVPLANLPSGILLGVTVFTVDGNWTPSPDTNSAIVEVLGGGGGGGGAMSVPGMGSAAGGGGAAGAYLRKVLQNPTGSYPVTIGLGGPGGAPGAAGTAGGNTTFGSGGGQLVAPGGGGGQGGGNAGGDAFTGAGVSGLATGGEPDAPVTELRGERVNATLSRGRFGATVASPAPAATSATPPADALFSVRVSHLWGPLATPGVASGTPDVSLSNSPRSRFTGASG